MAGRAAALVRAPLPATDPRIGRVVAGLLQEFLSRAAALRRRMVFAREQATWLGARPSSPARCAAATARRRLSLGHRIFRPDPWRSHLCADAASRAAVTAPRAVSLCRNLHDGARAAVPRRARTPAEHDLRRRIRQSRRAGGTLQRRRFRLGARSREYRRQFALAPPQPLLRS